MIMSARPSEYRPMKHAFILSDCEYPECSQKPFALLTANPTKEHHFVAQTEQRQHAHNPEVSPQNQNVYQLPLSLFHKPFRAHTPSVNIISNLAARNLYTLTFVDHSPNQYNLESWFNRHESGYEDACNLLRTLHSGRLKVPDALWRILRLKFLGILRNPYNHQNLFAHRLNKAISSHLPEVGFEFVRLISQRDPKHIEAIMKDYEFTFLGYVNWLSNLYGMLSEGVSQPSLFERMFQAAFSQPHAFKISLYRYTDRHSLCLFGDSGFCLQADKQTVSIGLNISHDMFAIMRFDLQHWHELKHHFHTINAKLSGDVHIIDNDHTQRITCNRLTIHQARQAVYGKSPNYRDYLD